MTKLTMLYRQYLRGSDLEGKPFQVQIMACKEVTVRPNPRAEDVVKWCLFVTGLPEGLPSGILIGPQMGAQLAKIFGDIDHDDLQGKSVVIYPVDLTVAGIKKAGIRFKPANGNGRPAPTEPPF